MDELHTTTLRDLIARFQAGENSALDSLIRRTQERMEQFARRMLGGFPGVRAREQVEDVVQNALITLDDVRAPRPTGYSTRIHSATPPRCCG